MKNSLLILLILLFPIQGISQEGTYYYGVNGKLNETEADAYLMKSVRKGIGNRYTIITNARLFTNEWIYLNTEKISVKSDDSYSIQRMGVTPYPGKSIRNIENGGNGKYHIEDYYNDRLISTANCSRLIPLVYDGMVTEYFENGNKKSESIYNENRLQSNKNWNSDGSPYIENIFYSTHTGPTYPGGNDAIQGFIADYISDKGLSTGLIQNEIILGAVVMETGTLDGIKIVYSSLPAANEDFIEALKALPAEWGPATLNGEKVRYYIQLPFYLKNNAVVLQKFEITKDGRMILVNE